MMFSVSGSYWPYVLATACWIGVFVWLAYRVLKSHARSAPMTGDHALQIEQQLQGAVRDTQAGRI